MLQSVVTETMMIMMMMMIYVFSVINQSVIYYHRGDDSTPEPSTTVDVDGPDAEVGPETGAFDEDVDVAAVDVCGGGGCWCVVSREMEPRCRWLSLTAAASLPGTFLELPAPAPPLLAVGGG